MNWNQLKALVWLRWRLFMVQFRKMNIWMKILLGLIAASVVCTSVGGAIFGFVGTLYLMPEDKPFFALIAFDGLCGLFLFAWAAGFVSELQRAEPISIEKLLHLPISVRGAFLLNYLSSFTSLTIVALLPPLIGLCCALPFVYGWKTLVALPLLFAFLLLITSVTYQIRGWLARMMSNPKRRRAIMTTIFMAFIAVTQLPGILATVFDEDKPNRHNGDNVAQVDQSDVVPGQIDATKSESTPDQAAEDPDTSTPTAESTETIPAADTELIEVEDAADKAARRARKREKSRAVLTSINRYVPFGWLPLGAYRAAEGILWPGILGLAGLLGLSVVSLNMSYRGTVNFYRGTTSKKRVSATSQNIQNQNTGKAKIRDLNLLPFLSPKLGTVTRANLTNMWRTPAVKMQLLIPFFVMFIPIFGLLKKRDELPADIGPLAGLGVVLFSMFMMFGLIMNIFGFDRNGFRSFMLLPLRPHEILLAKNISMFPVGCLMCVIPFCVVAVTFSFSWHTALACVAQIIAAYSIFCVMGNLVSTMFPFPTPTSAMKRVKPKWQSMLAQLVAFALFPCLMIPVAIPPVLSFALKKFDIWTGFSLNLPLSLVVAGLAVGFYWLMLEPTSRLLWDKQRAILLEVTKTE